MLQLFCVAFFYIILLLLLALLTIIIVRVIECLRVSEYFLYAYTYDSHLSSQNE